VQHRTEPDNIEESIKGRWILLLMVMGFLALLLISLSPTITYAASLRAGALTGYGDAVVSTDQIDRSESPMGFSFFVEYAFDAHRTFGVEHYRSFDMEAASSAVSLTGISGKWYFLTPVPPALHEEKVSSGVWQSNFSPYGFGGVGFDQSSILARNDDEADASAAGLYLRAGAGVDYPLWGRFGARGEFGYSMTVMGSGSIQTMQLIFGLYSYF
jgi:hypothetical protein